MSDLTDKIAAEHAPEPLGGCICSWEDDHVAGRLIQHHIAEVTETAVSAEFAPAPCVMTHTPPMDFAQCETHDTTFPLGGTCKFDGRDPFEVLYEEADEQRVRAVRAEMELEQLRDEVAHLRGEGRESDGHRNLVAHLRGELERANDLVAEFRRREETQDRVRVRLTGDVERLTQELEERYPCDGLCTPNSGPEEVCSRCATRLGEQNLREKVAAILDKADAEASEFIGLWLGSSRIDTRTVRDALKEIR